MKYYTCASSSTQNMRGLVRSNMLGVEQMSQTRQMPQPCQTPVLKILTTYHKALAHLIYVHLRLKSLRLKLERSNTVLCVLSII